MAQIKHIKLTKVLSIFYGLFLLGTGLMTIYFWLWDVDFSVGTSEKTSVFMSNIKDAGYIIPWLGIFKVIAGAMLFFKSTVKVGILMSVPYVVNILLYVGFISYQDYLMIGIVDGVLCFYLVYAYWDFYKSLFK